MKEEIKRAKCVQCSSTGHLYCTNDHHISCKGDHVYKSSNRGYQIGRDIFNCSTYNHYEQFNNGGIGVTMPDLRPQPRPILRMNGPPPMSQFESSLAR
jgi:hypothetical protein